MSILLIAAINIGAASLLALILSAVMLTPRRLRPHHHPRLHPRSEAPRRPSAIEPSSRAGRTHGARRVITGLITGS
jgi:hypothetical protein